MTQIPQMDGLDAALDPLDAAESLVCAEPAICVICAICGSLLERR